jgi:hypothetical protein
VAVISAQTDLAQFKGRFELQFEADPTLGLHVLRILDEYFRESTSPGLLVYEEFLVADKPLDRDARREVAQEIARAHQLMRTLLRP